jgi:ribosomal protein S18 acetylase RimI-like enzyme
MRMGGYPAKVRSLAFLSKGKLMASSGAAGAVLWPFGGGEGPMGREAAEVGFEEGAEVTRVAAALASGRLAGGRSDGAVWWADVAGEGRVHRVAEPSGAAISALALSPDGRRIAFGDEAGRAGVVEL